MFIKQFLKLYLFPLFLFQTSYLSAANDVCVCVCVFLVFIDNMFHYKVILHVSSFLIVLLVYIW